MRVNVFAQGLIDGVSNSRLTNYECDTLPTVPHFPVCVGYLVKVKHN